MSIVLPLFFSTLNAGTDSVKHVPLVESKRASAPSDQPSSMLLAVQVNTFFYIFLELAMDAS